MPGPEELLGPVVGEVCERSLGVLQTQSSELQLAVALPRLKIHGGVQHHDAHLSCYLSVSYSFPFLTGHCSLTMAAGMPGPEELLGPAVGEVCERGVEGLCKRNPVSSSWLWPRHA